MKYDFEFYYEERTAFAHTKEKALEIFRKGGFYKAVCYFVGESPTWFRILETEGDITSLKQEEQA